MGGDNWNKVSDLLVCFFGKSAGFTLTIPQKVLYYLAVEDGGI